MFRTLKGWEMIQHHPKKGRFKMKQDMKVSVKEIGNSSFEQFMKRFNMQERGGTGNCCGTCAHCPLA